ncbi:hypothetical protein MY11210_008729 [Beauveria gryllotalpidicola]
MPRRHSLAHQACELCRQRKRKCNGDGLNPCKACHESGAHCVYFAATRVSKADLREELARLQSINSDNSTLLDAISSRDTSPAQLSNILQRLSDGQSRAEVADMLTQRPDSRDGTSKGMTKTPFYFILVQRLSSHLLCEISAWRSNCKPCLLGSPATCAPTSASPSNSGTGLSITQQSAKSLISPVTTPSTIKSPSETHLQANISYYRLQLPQLLDAILAWDCLSFCPISKQDFARDFESGSGQHFSTALADALLALATLLARDKMAAIVASCSSSGDHVREDLGYSFAQEAIAALYNGVGLPQRIADIQALGLLALYCLGCGKMKDGLGFAGDFGAAIAEQWAANQSESVLAHRQTHANIYCAAVSFNRLLLLIQDYNKTIDELAVKLGVTRPPLQTSSSTDSSSSKTNLSGTIIGDAFFTRDISLLPNNPKVIAAKLFEFIEWVYKARFSPEKTLDQAVKVYRDSLQWYESFFAYTSSCTAETPLILFGHLSVYFQFGIMCLLTPFVLEPAEIALDGTLPMAICEQATASIGELTQHYSRLYNDGQLFDFMTFFKTAALAFLQVCKTDIPM